MILLTIGRNPDNRIVISDNTQKVSGYHGELRISQDGSIEYRDMSKNGTMLNGKLLHNETCNISRGATLVFPNNQTLDWRQVPMISSTKHVKKEITLGKHPENQIQISSEKASRYHALLRITRDGKYFIFDQSLNGTWVNGHRIPLYQDYPVRRTDKIEFAGNQLLDWKQVPRAGGLIHQYKIPLILIGLLCAMLGAYKYFAPVNITEKYQHSICLVYNSFYLAYMDGTDTLYYIGDSGIVDIRNERYKLTELKPLVTSGTGFFVSNSGKIITNKHVAAPWESELAIDKELILKKLGEIDAIYTGERRFTPKVVPVPIRMGVFLNESEIDLTDPLQNLITCELIRTAPEKEIDLALIQSSQKSLPPKAELIKRTDMITSKSQINVDDEITIIGFPFGYDLAINNAEDKIKSTSNHGKISKITDKYEIQYDAGSTHGASGSPVFNKKGQLIAVNYAGMEAAQGFNFGILATHIQHLLDD